MNRNVFALGMIILFAACPVSVVIDGEEIVLVDEFIDGDDRDEESEQDDVLAIDPAADGFGNGARSGSGFRPGLWLIDQPMHALYESAIFRFDEDKSIKLIAHLFGHYSDVYDPFSVTAVRPADSEFPHPDTCRLSDKWAYGNASVAFALEYVCADGDTRWLTSNTLEDGWWSQWSDSADLRLDGIPAIHHGHQWVWTHCDDAPERCANTMTHGVQE